MSADSASEGEVKGALDKLLTCVIDSITYVEGEYSLHWQYNDEWSFLDKGFWTRLGNAQTAVCNEVSGQVVCEVYGPPPNSTW